MKNDEILDIGEIARKMDSPGLESNQCVMNVLASMGDDIGMTDKLKEQNQAVKHARENFMEGMKNKVPMDIRVKQYTDLTEKLIDLNESVEVMAERGEPISEEMAEEFENSHKEISESANILTQPYTASYMKGDENKRAPQKGPIDPQELARIVLNKMIEMILSILTFGRYKRNERGLTNDNSPSP